MIREHLNSSKFIEETLGSKVKMNKVYMGGHSFGAATALLTIHKAPKASFAACLALDPWFLPLSNFYEESKSFSTDTPLCILWSHTF